MRVLFLVPLAMFAATTQTWEINSYQDFARGKMSGITLSRDGRLTAGPGVETYFDSAQSQIWSVATGPNGVVYAGTGSRGRVFRIDGAGRGSAIWSANEPLIFALAVDARGVVYAGSSPDGKIYRIENGNATEYFAPGARYIWALTFGPDGALYAGTGDQGKIFRITGAGQGSVYYETGQSNVTALAFDAKGALLAGSEPNGIVYRIESQGRAFVLYDANLPEIRSLAVAPDGSVYAAAMGGGAARQSSAASLSSSSASLPTISTSITVTDQQEALIAIPKPEASKPAAAQPVTSTSSTVDYGGDKAALYRIFPDNTVETLWTSKDESLYDIAFDGATLLMYTDPSGRIYRLDPDRKVTLLAQTNEGDATRLVRGASGILAATGSLGKLFRLSSTPGGPAWFESTVHDSNTVAKWGRLAYRGSGAVFKTRSGNTARPDATWSDWSVTNNGLIVSPNARYIQWRAELGTNASVDDVTLAYLPQNSAPVVRSVTVSAAATAQATAKAAPANGAATAAYSITVSDTGETAVAAGASAQAVSRTSGQQLQISWQADDPDGDKLLYSLFFRADDETRWKLLRANMTENAFLMESDVLADARYYFRVVASDRTSNPADIAREADGTSAPVWIDGTPPVVTLSMPRRSGDTIELDVDAEDRASALKRCEYSFDAGPWSPVEASDGVTDSPRERFAIRVPNVATGEHMVAVRVYDASGNAGLARVVVR